MTLIEWKYQFRINKENKIVKIEPDVEAIFEFNENRKVIFDEYRPAHLVKENYLATGLHHYYNISGKPLLGTITFLAPEHCPNCLWVGKEIIMQEGSRVVGKAKITKIFNKILEKEMIDRCEECGLWNVNETDVCPKCGSTMDLIIDGLSLSWKCRCCDYGIATTANKLCFFDNKKFEKECYSKITDCPYAEK